MAWKDKLPDRSTCEKRGNRRGKVHNWKFYLKLDYGNYDLYSCQDCPAIKKVLKEGLK